MTMNDVDDRAFVLVGDLTIATYPEQRKTAITALKQGRTIVDFQKVNDLDSSAVAFMLECVRVSKKQAKFRSLPKALSGLVDLYGVADLFDTKLG